MRLTLDGIAKTDAWEKADVLLPRYDPSRVAADTRANPVWLHFGAGNIFRGFIAQLQHNLLNEGLSQSGIIAAETFDFEIVRRIYDPHDNLSLLVRLKPDGNTEKEVIASVAEALSAETDMPRLNEIFRRPSLAVASFTITEKGYALRDTADKLLPVAAQDMERGPESAKHAVGIAAALMLARYRAGALPIALVSMDNCSRNGEKLKNAVLEMAARWRDNGYVENGFSAYLADGHTVAFPWSMIDKITPFPSPQIAALLADAGIDGMEPVVTAKNTRIAPFVNAEAPQYLIIEDDFPNGRPPLEKVGVYLTDRETVSKAERMKVSTCLNPLHTALAIFGCLLGYDRISDEMRDADLRALVEAIGYKEGMPVVADPGILDASAFLDEVINVRLPNPYIPDTPQRIAADTSQKLPIRYGETIKAYIARADLDPRDLTFIPLTIAAWLRYLLALDDEGREMPLSSDPMLEQVRSAVAGIEFGRPESCRGRLRPLLSNEVLFGADLTACGLADKIEMMFRSMIAGRGAVRETLRRTLSGQNRA